MTNFDDAAKRFAADTANHEMTVLQDDGLYRHVRFKAPNTGFYWFDLITWPGHLAVVGDFGDGYVFARVPDMFEFFRNARYGINPQYWAEKVIDGRSRCKRYSEDKFRRHVDDHIASYGDEVPGLRGAVEQRILGDRGDWDLTFEEGAREALRDFEFLPEIGVRATHVAEARAKFVQISGDPASTRDQRNKARHALDRAVRDATFQFVDTWEWDLTDWDWSFLWCCHAIQWGIRQYDEAKDVKPAVETVAVGGGVL